MSKFSILHITDAHFGQSGMSGRWPTLKAQFFADLRHVLELTGGIDLVAFTGDIANRGLAEEYDEASRFMDELGLVFLNEVDSVPPFATVPGNHDVSRPPESSIVKGVLERYWDQSHEKMLFEDVESNDLRDFSRSMFKNYADWIDGSSHALPPVSIDHRGVLPGDYVASESSGDFRVGIIGLNSTFRHVSDYASEGSLTIASQQVQQAAGGDLPSWSLKHDVAIALTHHPMSWLRDRDEAEDALFNGASTTRLHLCGHLHLEKYSAKAIGTDAGRVIHQGQSLFGLEQFGTSGGMVDRQHGYAVVTLEKSEGQISASVWPRKADRLNDGTWAIDRHTGFGLSRGENRSRRIFLFTPSMNSQKPGAANDRVEEPTVPPAAKQRSSEDHIPAFLNDLKRGFMVSVIGDRFIAGEEPQQLTFSRFRAALWASLDTGEPDDPTCTTDQLINLAAERSATKMKDVVAKTLGNPPSAMIDELEGIVRGPWTAVLYMSPVRDLESCPTVIAAHGESILIDGTAAPYRLPASDSKIILKLASSIPVEGSTRLLLDEHLARTPENNSVDWRSFARQILARSPAVFLTDSVSSLSFWQWISDRDASAGKYRMPAYLVCPKLPLQYMSLLERYDVKWIESTVSEFSKKYLQTGREEFSAGRATIARRKKRSNEKTALALSTLRGAAEPGSREYLLGRAPGWGDVTDGFAARLSAQSRIMSVLDAAGAPSMVLVTGTAGSGRTTALMQCALDLQAQHKSVAWIDSTVSRSKVSEIVDQILEEGYEYVFVDDVDVFGAEAGRLLEGLRGGSASGRVVIAGVRSVRSFLLEGISFSKTLELGNLTSADLDALVAVLRQHRATANKRLSDSDVRTLLLDSGGQLIVGMIQATSGVPFAQKIASECSQLSPAALMMYGCAALVTAENEAISAAQLQDAVGGNENESWRTLKRLEENRLLQQQPHTNLFEVRHRVVAEEVRNYLARVSALAPVAAGTLRAYAAAAAETRDRSNPARRTLIRLLNHSYLIRTLGLSADKIRSIYDGVEDILEQDFHYWLQRGSFEVEKGDETYAMHDLTSANTTAGGENDYKVLTEFAVLRLKIAKNNRGPEALALALSAIEDLHKVIRMRGLSSPHTISILASAGVPWLETALIGRSEKKERATETLRLLNLAKPLMASNGEIARRLPHAIETLETLLNEDERKTD